jgi:hypothetical protein
MCAMESEAKRETKSVYLLWHTRGDDELLVGVYENEAEANAAQNRVRSKPGFVEGVGEFEIAEYLLNQDHWKEGYKLV